MNENKTNINWLIKIYPRTEEISDKIRIVRYKILHVLYKNILK